MLLLNSKNMCKQNSLTVVNQKCEQSNFILDVKKSANKTILLLNFNNMCKQNNLLLKIKNRCKQNSFILEFKKVQTKQFYY